MEHRSPSEGPQHRHHPQVWLGLSLAASAALLVAVAGTALLGFSRVLPAVAESRQADQLHDLLQAANSGRIALRGDIYATAREAARPQVASTTALVDVRRDSFLLRAELDEIRAFEVPPQLQSGVADFVARMTTFVDQAERVASQFAGGAPGAGAGLAGLVGTFATSEGPVDAILGAVDTHAERAANSAEAVGASARRQVAFSFAFALFGLLVTAVLLLRNGRNQAVLLATLHRDTTRQGFNGSLARALELATAEPDVYEVVPLALMRAVPHRPAQLLLSDSSRAHLRTAATSEAGNPACEVEAPWSCPAVRQGGSLTMPSGRALDACPKLRSRDGGAHSATCLPLTFMGSPLGVLHVLGPEDQPLSDLEHDQAMDLAAQVGARIGTLRAFATTQLQADTDPLTGLRNRRSLEVKVRQLQALNRPFALAMADLDHFKAINDTFGHDAGDRALRTFARASQAQLRPDDLMARFGGEEFVFVLPEVDAVSAARVLQRGREELPTAVAAAGCPVFTASYGVAHSSDGATLDEIVAAADLALRHAKSAGRDRIVLLESLSERTALAVVSAVPDQRGRAGGSASQGAK